MAPQIQMQLYTDVRTGEQGLCVLLVVAGVQRGAASGLEDAVEKLAAALAVLHGVVALHRHQQRNQVRHGEGAVDHGVCRKTRNI